MHGLAGNRFLPSRLGYALSQQWSRRVELLKTATVGACGKATSDAAAARQRSQRKHGGGDSGYPKAHYWPSGGEQQKSAPQHDETQANRDDRRDQRMARRRNVIAYVDPNLIQGAACQIL